MSTKMTKDFAVKGKHREAMKVGGVRCGKRSPRIAAKLNSTTALTAAEKAFGSPMALDPASLGFDMKAVEEEMKRPSYDKRSHAALYPAPATKARSSGKPGHQAGARRHGMIHQPGYSSCTSHGRESQKTQAVHSRGSKS